MTWSELFSPCYKSADPSSLEEFEQHLDIRLPDQYRSFLIKFGGGRFDLEHEIALIESNDLTAIETLWPLSNSSPGIGIIEARNLDERGKYHIPTLLKIGDDGGIGFFFIGLRYSHRGKLFFAYKEDHWFPEMPESPARDFEIPDAYKRICDRFEDLPALVWKYRTI